MLLLLPVQVEGFGSFAEELVLQGRMTYSGITSGSYVCDDGWSASGG